MKNYALLVMMFSLFLFVGISEAAENEKKVNFAVLGLKNGTGVDSGETDILADRLRVNLFRTGRVNMMERSQMDEILKEQGFQASGACNDAECAVEMGQMLGVQRVVGGSVGKLGSLFLVNLRVIDVETAKIIKVVSKDIAGGIEGVVEVLSELAEELVNDISKSAPEKEESLAEKSTLVEEKSENEASSEPKEPKEEFTSAGKIKRSKSTKNRNRGGVALSFTMFPGGIKTFLAGSSSSKYYEENWLNSEHADYLESLSAFNNVRSDEINLKGNLDIIISIGSFIAIDVSPGISFNVRKLMYDVNSWSDEEGEHIYGDRTKRLQILSPHVTLNTSFVKRFHPLKINLGFAVDFNFNLLKYSYEQNYNSYYTYFNDDKDYTREFNFSVSFGPKIGVELLATKRFGIGIDYRLKIDHIDVGLFDTDNYYFSDSNTDVTAWDEYWKFKMPSSAVVISLNFYKD